MEWVINAPLPHGYSVIERKPGDYQKLMRVFHGIWDSGNQAEAMTTDELCTALAELKLEGGEHIASLESAVKGEALHRLKHPFTWKLKQLWNRYAHKV